MKNMGPYARPVPPGAESLIPLLPANQVAVPVRLMADVVNARRHGRKLSEQLGADDIQATLVVTMISELARNILLFAEHGTIRLRETTEQGRHGITVVAEDDGPGIADLQRALLGGYSTCGRLGLGLNGVRRIADEFDVTTGPSKGTTVTVRTWFD